MKLPVGRYSPVGADLETYVGYCKQRYTKALPTYLFGVNPPSARDHLRSPRSASANSHVPCLLQRHLGQRLRWIWIANYHGGGAMNVSMDVCVPLPEVALHQLLVLLRIVSA